MRTEITDQRLSNLKIKNATVSPSNYVYEYHERETRQLIYVGIGNDKGAGTFTRARDTRSHASVSSWMIDTSCEIKVTIVATGVTREVARYLESSIIRNCRPLLNVRSGGSVTETRRKKIHYCPDLPTARPKPAPVRDKKALTGYILDSLSRYREACSSQDLVAAGRLRTSIKKAVFRYIKYHLDSNVMTAIGIKHDRLDFSWVDPVEYATWLAGIVTDYGPGVSAREAATNRLRKRRSPERVALDKKMATLNVYVSRAKVNDPERLSKLLVDRAKLRKKILGVEARDNAGV